MGQLGSSSVGVTGVLRSLHLNCKVHRTGMWRMALLCVWQWVLSNSETVSVLLRLVSSLGYTGFLTWRSQGHVPGEQVPPSKCFSNLCLCLCTIGRCKSLGQVRVDGVGTYKGMRIRRRDSRGTVTVTVYHTMPLDSMRLLPWAPLVR